MKKQILILTLAILLILPLVIAPPFQTVDTASGYDVRVDSIDAIKVGTEYDFHIHVFNQTNGYPIIKEIGCYLHIYNASGHHAFEGYDEVASHNFDYAWDLNTSILNKTGTYSYIAQCNGTEKGGFVASDFEVNPTGAILSDASAISFLGILFSIVFISFLFMYLSFKLIDGDKTYPAGLFFLLMGVLFIVQALYMGVIYSRDYISSAIANPQFKLFFGVMFGVIGVIFISLLFLILHTLKEFRERKSAIGGGEYFDPKTKQYK